jgi:hypothetical protein
MSNSTLVVDGNSTTFYRNFSIPIISGLFSTSEKYFPLYATSSDDIRIVLKLDTQVNAFVIPDVNNSTVTCNIVSPEIVVDLIELDSEAMGQVAGLYAGRDLVLHTTTYHCYESTIISGTSGQYTGVLPSKVMSAKNAIAVWRKSGTTGVQEGYSLSSFTNPFTGINSSFGLNVGGMRVPIRPIPVARASDVSSFFAELQKAFHGLHDLRLAGNLPYRTYVSSESVAVGDAPSVRGFIAGVNLDALHGQTDLLLSGTDFSKVSVYNEAYFTTAIDGNQLQDVFVYHDQLIKISPNGIIERIY